MDADVEIENKTIQAKPFTDLQISLKKATLKGIFSTRTYSNKLQLQPVDEALHLPEEFYTHAWKYV